MSEEDFLTSTRSRFLISAVANFTRSGFSFLTGLLLARSLGPGKYGDFSFLWGSFIAIRLLLDMGASHAFFTFLSQRLRGRKFIASYIAWQVLQCLAAVLVIALMPDRWLSSLWLGHPRGLVLLAFLAVFLVLATWPTMVQIGESNRLTHRAQGLSVALAAGHFALVAAFSWMGTLRVTYVFLLLIGEYLVGHAVAMRYLLLRDLRAAEPFNARAVLGEFAAYCAPLVLYSLFSFSFEFADRWMLQHFGGSAEQAYYSVAFQIAAVNSLLTQSVLTIFWREIAAAHERKDAARVEDLYQKTSRFLLAASAILSGFFIPWSDQIVFFVLGPKYAEGAWPLAIMLFFPIHATMGLIGGTMLFATGRVKDQVIMGILYMAMAIPISYWVQARPDAAIPGLGLGALGMSLKTVLLTILFANVTAWYLARVFHWRYDASHQWITVAAVVSGGWGAAQASRFALFFLPSLLPLAPAAHCAAEVGLAFGLYAALVGIFFRFFPSYFGFSWRDLVYFGEGLRARFSTSP